MTVNGLHRLYGLVDRSHHVVQVYGLEIEQPYPLITEALRPYLIPCNLQDCCTRLKIVSQSFYSRAQGVGIRHTKMLLWRVELEPPRSVTLTPGLTCCPEACLPMPGLGGASASVAARVRVAAVRACQCCLACPLMRLVALDKQTDWCSVGALPEATVLTRNGSAVPTPLTAGRTETLIAPFGWKQFAARSKTRGHFRARDRPQSCASRPGRPTVTVIVKPHSRTH